MSFQGIERIFILCICIPYVYGGTYQSSAVIQSYNTDFQPANPIELLTTVSSINSIFQCYKQCHMNFQCRTFVYKSAMKVCYLYESSVDTGNVISPASNATPSIVGAIQYTPDLFVSYGLTCDQCSSTRYLACVSNTCQCLPNTFWNGTMCLNQVYYGASCGTVPSMCRNADLLLSCLSICNICVGPPSGCNSPSNSSVPIALWHFDGNLSYPSTTAVGSVPFVSGHQGLAIQLSGASSISAAFYNISYRSFSVEMWIYPMSISDNMGLFSQYGYVSSDAVMSLKFDNATLLLTYGWDDTQGTTQLQINQWYHVAFVYNCNNRSSHIFLNGIEEMVTHPTGLGTGPFRGQCGATLIGNAYNNIQFNGRIDEVSLWDRVRTASEILADSMISG